MTVSPNLAARLPENVLNALRLAEEAPMSASCAFAIILTVLHDGVREARERDGLDTDTVDCLREQVAWLLERVQTDLDSVGRAVRETGLVARAG
jgi:hypothetical protein